MVLKTIEEFQSLIGRLSTLMRLHTAWALMPFQSLIGRLSTLTGAFSTGLQGRFPACTRWRGHRSVLSAGQSRVSTAAILAEVHSWIRPQSSARSSRDSSQVITSRSLPIFTRRGHSVRRRSLAAAGFRDGLAPCGEVEAEERQAFLRRRANAFPGLCHVPSPV